MNRTELACYALIASAFILGALVLVHADRLADNAAYAEMVVHKDQYTVLSSQIDAAREVVYILDSRTERLNAYALNPTTKVVELLDSMDVAEQVAQVLKQVAGPGGRGK